MTFQLSDNSLNRQGFRVLTEGINLEEFRKNPIMFWMHKRDSKWNETNMLPIGIWTNIRVEDGKLLADPVFDEDDEFAMTIKKKVDKQHIRMTSIGIEPIELSEAPEHILQGQTRPTVSKSEMVEASIVDIGANRNSLRLYKDGKMIEMSANSENYIPLLNQTQKPITMKKILNLLTLADNSDEDAVVVAVQGIMNKNQQLSKDLSDKDKTIAELNQKLADQQKEKAKQLIDGAIAAKKITEKQRQLYTELAEENFERTEKIIAELAGTGRVIDQLGADSKMSKEFEGKTWDELHKAGKLEQLKMSNLPMFKQLYMDKFGKEYQA